MRALPMAWTPNGWVVGQHRDFFPPPRALKRSGKTLAVFKRIHVPLRLLLVPEFWPAHQLLDFFRFDRDGFHEIHVSCLLNQKIIFKPNSESFILEVNARFNRKHPAGLDWLDG